MKNYHFALADYQQALDLDKDDWDIKSRISRENIQLKPRTFFYIFDIFIVELRNSVACDTGFN